MNEPQIETELEKLARATEPRASMVASVMQRIERLGAMEQHPLHRTSPIGRIYRSAGLLVAAAACVAALFFVLRPVRNEKPQERVDISRGVPAGASENSIPRLIDYQRAFKESPQALEALLQRRPFESYSEDERAIRVADEMRPDLHLN